MIPKSRVNPILQIILDCDCSSLYRILAQVDGPTSLVTEKKVERLEGEPWYKEVQELRKVANAYKVNKFEMLRR